MYELIILGFLLRSVSHGYRIARIINDMIGPYAKMSSGRLYPLFGKLVKEGLIAIVPGHEENDRQRQYKITEQGILRFQQLMLDTASNLGEYRKLFGFKLIFIDLLQKNEQMYLLNHYINYCQTHIFYVEGEIHDLKGRESQLDMNMHTSIYVMEHNQQQWQSELEWAYQIRKELQEKVDPE